MSCELFIEGNLPLKNGEEGVLCIHFWRADTKEPSKEEIEEFPLCTTSGSEGLYHGSHCGGDIAFVKITDSKKVLFCKKCGLRISFPVKIEKFGELKGWV